MKKNIFLSSIVILIGLYGCTKEGPIGPAGPAGPAGATGTSGTSIIAVETFTASSSSWVSVTTNYYKYTHTNTAITQEIVDMGTIQVFSKSTTYPDWYAWPNVVAGAGQAGWRFNYNLNTLTLLGDNMTSGPPPTVTIKMVIMK